MSTRVLIGMVLQAPVLLHWRSVLGNVLLPLEELGERGRQAVEDARALLRLVGLEGCESQRPSHLFGDMQHRVALCRALIIKRVVLLMDERFRARDAITREHLKYRTLEGLAGQGHGGSPRHS